MMSARQTLDRHSRNPVGHLNHIHRHRAQTIRRPGAARHLTDDDARALRNPPGASRTKKASVNRGPDNRDRAAHLPRPRPSANASCRAVSILSRRTASGIFPSWRVPRGGVPTPLLIPMAVAAGVVVIVVAVAVVLVVLLVTMSMRGRQKRSATQRSETRHDLADAHERTERRHRTPAHGIAHDHRQTRPSPLAPPRPLTSAAHSSHRRPPPAAPSGGRPAVRSESWGTLERPQWPRSAERSSALAPKRFLRLSGLPDEEATGAAILGWRVMAVPAASISLLAASGDPAARDLFMPVQVMDQAAWW